MGLWLNVPFLLLLIASYYIHLISPEQFWPSAFLGLLLPYLAIVNIGFAVFWILLRSWKLLLPVAVLALGYSELSLYFQFKGTKPSEKLESTIRVLSYNTLNLNYNVLTGKSNKPGQSNFVIDQDADIICLQESNLHGGLNRAAFKNYKVIHPKSKIGPLILSKFKVINTGEITFENTTNNKVTFADLQINPKKKIRVYSCHLQSYRIRPEDYSIIDSIDFNQEKKQLKEIKTIAGKLKYGFIQRSIQADIVRKHIDNCEYPVIVCGDFNDTPASYVYHTVKGNLLDAYAEQGQWIQPTYSSKLPSFRIDYILFSNTIRCKSFERNKLTFSDHYPIQADFHISNF